MNHGTAGLSGRREYERERMPLQSKWFLDRGFAVLIPMRRGHGSSTPPFAESYGFCLNPDYVASSRHAFFGDWSVSWGPRVDAFIHPLFH